MNKYKFYKYKFYKYTWIELVEKFGESKANEIEIKLDKVNILVTPF